MPSAVEQVAAVFR